MCYAFCGVPQLWVSVREIKEVGWGRDPPEDSSDEHLIHFLRFFPLKLQPLILAAKLGSEPPTQTLPCFIVSSNETSGAKYRFSDFARAHTHTDYPPPDSRASLLCRTPEEKTCDSVK